MQDFLFYIEIGLKHVLDLAAYDHILFLAAMSLPFTFRSWKKVVFLATVFTIAHCLSLALSVYGIVTVDVKLIEFLIPLTILLTAIINLIFVARKPIGDSGNLFAFNMFWHFLFTGFFGLIHGFGFSNYFKMLMSGEEEKLVPLLGFATGIELSQVLIVLLVLVLAYLAQFVLKIRQRVFVGLASILVIVITIPMLIDTFPW